MVFRKQALTASRMRRHHRYRLLQHHHQLSSPRRNLLNKERSKRSPPSSRPNSSEMSLSIPKQVKSPELKGISSHQKSPSLHCNSASSGLTSTLFFVEERRTFLLLRLHHPRVLLLRCGLLFDSATSLTHSSVLKFLPCHECIK